MEKELLEKVKKNYDNALSGRNCWLRIKESYHLDNDWFLIIMPEDDDVLNDKALRYLPAFLDRKYVTKAIVAYKDSYEITREQIAFHNIKVCYESLSDIEMEQLILYYKLHDFFKNLVVISLSEPFGTHGMIGHCDITLDDYINDALYV